jgi:hypothetical protein
MNRKIADGWTVAEAKDPLANLNSRERELVEEALRNYPELTVEETIEILREFGGL